MKAKVALLAGAAAGYVLGTRAGKERYEQIKSAASDLWQHKTVQARVSDAESFVSSHAPDVQHKVTEAAKSAVDSARSKFGSSGDEDLDFTDEPGLSDSEETR
jgi:oxygen-dependent protoporphyrinogen oxidase